MRLRRGMVRESCDFCHRRKIKCDRLPRNDLGHTSCSQCALRHVPCRMDDSDDIRLRGRERLSSGADTASPASAASPANTPSPNGRSHTKSSCSRSNGRSAAATTRARLQNKRLSSAPSPSPTEGNRADGAATATPVSLASPSSIQQLALPPPPPPPPPSPQVLPPLATTQQQQTELPPHPALSSLSSSLPAPPLSSSALARLDYLSPVQPVLADDLAFLEDPFQLNADSIFFLDQIFMGYPDTPAWPGPAPATLMASSEPQPPPPQPLVPAQASDPTVSQPMPVQTRQQQQQQQYYAPPQNQSLPPPPPPQPPFQAQPAPPGPAAASAASTAAMQAGGYDPPPWVRCGLDGATFRGALRAYFEYTTRYLPILLEDAFWQDYHAGRCSLSLIYAVACRGLPFTSSSPPSPSPSVGVPAAGASGTDGHRGNAARWALQHRVAEQFREAFFGAQLRANHSPGRVRLDDLEALALMVRFKHRGAADTGASATPSALAQLHAHLADLYLTHDSMVLMTMQSGISGAADGAGAPVSSGTPGVGGDPTAPLARLSDRRILLFWHVYGLDAFHCLDKKTLSRIPDFNSLRTNSSVGSTGSGGYLDAVLDLSVIARTALTTLSSAASRRRGIRGADVYALYARLDSWQRGECPPLLRPQRDARGRLSLGAGLDGAAAESSGGPGGSGGPSANAGSGSVSGSSSSSALRYVQLHRAVVWILVINCYMQIGECVGEYGIAQQRADRQPDGDAVASLAAEALALRVEAECARSLRDAVEVAQSLLQYGPNGSSTADRHKYDYSLADLGPSIVRDCCAGLCFWACRRGSRWLREPLPALLRRRPSTPSPPAPPAAGGPSAPTAWQRLHARSYVDAARVLLDVVATAVSHADTEGIVQGLDEQMAALEAGLGDTMAEA